MTSRLFVLNYKKVGGKKGSIIDALPLLVMLFVFGISISVGYVIYDGLVDAGFFTTVTSSVSADLQQNADDAYSLFDVLGVFVFVGTLIASLLGALLIRSHPAFFFISIVLLMIQVVFAVVLSNTWDAFIGVDVMDAAEQKFVFVDTILSNLPVLCLVMVLLIALVVYAVNPSGVVGGGL